MRLFQRLFLVLLVLFFCSSSVFAEPTAFQVHVTRTLNRKFASPMELVAIQLSCSVDGDVAGLIIIEQFPVGSKFVNSTSDPPADGVKLDEVNGEVKWLFMNSQRVSSSIIINYTVELPATSENVYTFRGSWKAINENAIASDSTPTTEISVVNTPVMISCEVASSRVRVGEEVVVSGSISPPDDNVTVFLNYTNPDASVIQRKVTTLADGSFRCALKVDVKGLWSVIASWSRREGGEAVSSIVYFTVEPSADSTSWTIIVTIVALIMAVAAVLLLILLILRRRSRKR